MNFRTYRPGLPKDVIAPIMRNGQALPVVGRLWPIGDYNDGGDDGDNDDGTI